MFFPLYNQINLAKQCKLIVMFLAKECKELCLSFAVTFKLAVSILYFLAMRVTGEVENDDNEILDGLVKAATVQNEPRERRKARQFNRKSRTFFSIIWLL